MYSDGQWGPQEYSRWPQIFCPEAIHHATIPAYPDDGDDAQQEDSVLVRNWSSKDFYELPEIPDEHRAQAQCADMYGKFSFWASRRSTV